MKKFKPEDLGFIKSNDDEFILVREFKVVAGMHFLNFTQGIPIEYVVFRVVHCSDGTTKMSNVFEGKIPSIEFGRELMKNTLWKYFEKL
jgi:hypothetical protein